MPFGHVAVSACACFSTLKCNCAVHKAMQMPTRNGKEATPNNMRRSHTTPLTLATPTLMATGQTLIQTNSETDAIQHYDFYSYE